MTGYILEGIPLLIGGNMYQFPCPTDGQCRKLLFERYGWNVKIYSLWGYKRIFGVRYRCCTQCHLPLNKKVADWLNQELGYTSDDIEIDKDFMELLNGI